MDTSQVIGKVESVLTETFSTTVTVTGWDRSRLHASPSDTYLWPVARCTLAGVGSRLPASVAVKWLRDDSGGWRSDPRQLLTERAALEFLGELGLAAAPRLIASDRDTSLLVLEDLHPRRPLYDLLDGPESAAARTGLVAFATAKGSLAAATAGQSERYYERRLSLGAVDPRKDIEGDIAERWMKARAAAIALDVPPPSGAEAEMTYVMERLFNPGPFLAFSNGDPGDNNFLVLGSDGRIIDFEFAGYRHALLDGACLHLPGPRWIVFPDPAKAGLEALYRSALVAGIPEAADDRIYGEAMSAAVMATVFERITNRIPKVDSRPPGDGSRPQIITTLEYAATVAMRHRTLPDLAAWCHQFAGTLRRRWPDADALLNALGTRPPAWIRRGSAG